MARVGTRRLSQCSTTKAGDPRRTRPARGEAVFQGLRTVIYAVSDLQKAKEWYSQVLSKEPYFAEFGVPNTSPVMDAVAMIGSIKWLMLEKCSIAASASR